MISRGTMVNITFNDFKAILDYAYHTYVNHDYMGLTWDKALKAFQETKDVHVFSGEDLAEVQCGDYAATLEAIYDYDNSSGMFWYIGVRAGEVTLSCAVDEDDMIACGVMKD